MVLIVFIVAGSIGAVLILSKKTPSSSPMAHAIQIVNGTVTVNANGYVDYVFSIPPGSSSIHVSGNFTVQGNGGSGIIVYIFDSTNFDNYEIGAYFGALYQSSQTTTAPIDSNLDSNGTYYLVLDNTLSTIAQTVNIQASVAYFTS